MKYVVDIPPELADEVNRQVKSGKYKSPQDFMLAAIQNQAYLETVEVERGSLPTQQTMTSPASDPSLTTKLAGDRLLLPPEATRINVVPISDNPRHDHLSGLSNRLFPVKPIVRVLGNLIAESGSEYVVLDELQEKSAEVARELGRVIQRKDKTLGRKRGTIIAAGLPVGREDKAKSRFRYQFVGFISKSKPEGAAPTLKFLTIVKGEKNSSRAGLTEFGLKFSALPNPIIDRQDYTTPFSDEEIEFLLEHMATQLPGEAKLMRLVLKSVNDGVDTPDALNPKLAPYQQGWTENEVIAERVGLISRMSELGLLEREKKGVRVTYLLSARGRTYLARLTELGN